MKEEESMVGENQSSHPQQKIVDHPPLYYNISEVYSVRKESINNSNDLIYKKLSRQFQRIKKLRMEVQGSSILSPEYDYEGTSLRRDFRRLHDAYNTTTKANIIVKRRIDKMRNKVDAIKSEVERDELNAVQCVDVNKLINKVQLVPPAAPTTKEIYKPKW
jgi:hypothetical protein